MAHGQKQLHSWQRRTVHRLDAQARHSKYSRLDAQAQRHLCLLWPYTDCASTLIVAIHLPW